MWFFQYFFHWPFHQKLVSKSHLTTLFCQSLHHLLTPNASSFFVKSSAVFIRENFLRFAGLQFEVGDDCMQVSPKVCDDCQGGLLWFTFQRANHNWSDWCNMIILKYMGKIPNFRFWGYVLTRGISILFTEHFQVHLSFNIIWIYAYLPTTSLKRCNEVGFLPSIVFCYAFLLF